jgi:hypothetical protein
MRPASPHSPLVTLAYLCLIIVGLCLFFFVIIPALGRFLDLVNTCLDHYSWGHCLLGLFAYLD